MSRTESFEEATDSLLAGSANLAWMAVNRNNFRRQVVTVLSRI
jgi:hypothetical protein